jgi:hypothetical protein
MYWCKQAVGLTKKAIECWWLPGDEGFDRLLAAGSLDAGVLIRNSKPKPPAAPVCSWTACGRRSPQPITGSQAMLNSASTARRKSRLAQRMGPEGEPLASHGSASFVCVHCRPLPGVVRRCLG